jgi:predicted extracellular nuclease
VLAALAAGLVPAAPAVASPTGVVVDELRLRGPAGGNDEFVELRNAGAAPVSIAGYRLQGCAAASGAPSTRATVPDGVTLAPGQAYLFTNSAASGYSGSVPGDQTYATGVTDLTAANASGVRIVDAAGATVDGVGAPGSAECREGAGLTTPGTAGDQAFRRTQDTDRNEADLTGPVAGDPQNRASAGAPAEPEPEPEPRVDGACGDPAIAIGAVQGPGAASPRDGETVTVEGSVVGDFQDAGRLGGFYVQDAGDGDAATSDGLFVFDPAGPAVAPGDRVRVTGEADEFFGLTQLTDVQRRVTVCGAGEQPAATPVDLPLPPAARERFEGMRVTFPDTLAVTEHFELARFGRVTLSEGGPLLTPTEVAEPGEPARAVAAANAARAISLDDASDASDPRPRAAGDPEDSCAAARRRPA